ncbi:MAG: hypothetical protein KIS92_00390 [Planctomycetota bacterium]|nr:hypothetical protein [Planctomycetota bacterium]
MKAFASFMFALLAVVQLGCSAADTKTTAAENPYKKAKVGQWSEYKTVSEIMGTKTEVKAKTTITAKDEASVTLSTVTEVNGTALPAQTVVIKFEDLEKAQQTVKSEELEKGSETLSVGGKSYACTWVKTKVTAEANGAKSVTIAKVWVCEDVPLSGLVKSESTTTTEMNGNEMKTVATMELLGAGS